MKANEENSWNVLLTQAACQNRVTASYKKTKQYVSSKKKLSTCNIRISLDLLSTWLPTGLASSSIKRLLKFVGGF